MSKDVTFDILVVFENLSVNRNTNPVRLLQSPTLENSTFRFGSHPIRQLLFIPFKIPFQKTFHTYIKKTKEKEFYFDAL